jgi:lysyl-tRNA synthetase class 2
MASLEELRSERLRKLETLRARKLDPYPARVSRSHTTAELHRDFEHLAAEKKVVQAVGRVRGVRLHGGSSFIDIEDGSGKLQIFAEQKTLGEECYAVVRELTDAGDFIEVSGTLFKTKKEEETLAAATFRIIAKALRPVPEEHFGLKDTEERLRKRYLDLIANPETKDIFVRKARFWSSIREFLAEHGFLEVDTPVLEEVPGGADATPFVTHYDALDQDFYLRISLELPLKKIIIGGLERVYEIGKIFRNEGISAEHLQDYLHCEFYWAYADYNDLIGMVENLYKKVIEETTGGLKTRHEESAIEWGVPWPRLDYFELLEKHLGVRLDAYDDDRLRRYAEGLELEIPAEWERGRILDYIWKKKVRPGIIQPIFLINHPVEVSPLAKRREDDPRRVERVQVIAAGTELGNGWSELNDPLEQRARFEEQMKLREKGDVEAQMMDESFVEALEYGMPPTAGFGFSERLFSVLMNKPIRETVIFPPMREEHD